MTAESARKFHFLREIASGGFGSVYLAKVIHGDGFSRLAAIKLLHPKWSENEEIASRMRDEARLLGWLRHKNIVDVMDLTLIDGRCAVLMEYLEAVDLKVVVTACQEHGARVPLRVCLEICAAAASALDAAYNRPPIPGEKPLRVIHRDIKPSNIMVDAQGTVKVLDFGVARADFEAREARTQELSFGSIEYMPPERLFFEPESPASDVYSLGSTLFEMLSLDKLGKAKLRPAEQERFLESRFDDLLQRHPMPSQEIEDILHDLLADMLAFGESDRPSAADAVFRMRSFARRLSNQESLEEWAEQVVPPLIRQQERKRAAVAAEDPLIDKVVVEDTGGFRGRGAAPAPPPPPTPDPALARALKPIQLGEAQLAPPQFNDIPPVAAASPPAVAVAPAPPREPPRVEAQRPLTPAPAPQAPPPSAHRPPAPAPAPPPVGRTIEAPLPQVGRATTREQRLPPPPAAPRAPELHARGERPSGPPTEEEVQPTVMIPVRTGGGVDPEPAGGGGLMGMVAVSSAFAVVGFLVFFALALVLVVAVVAAYWGSTPEVVAPPAVIETPAPQPELPPAAVAGPSARFVSLFPDTRKITARCASGSFEGVAEVVVPVEGAGDCTLVAIDPQRRRVTVVVKAVAEREYRCFSGGDNQCD